MQHRKKTASIAIAAATALALTGCAAGESDGGGDAQVELEMVTLGSLGPALEKVVEQFESAHENITVAVEEMEGGQYFTVLPTQITSGQGPDLFLTFPGNGNSMATAVLGPNGYLADLSDLDYVGNLSPQLKDLASVDGKTYYVPGFGAALGAIYDQDAWTEAGLEPPTTFDEVLSLCGEAQDMDKVLFALGISSALQIQGTSYALVGSNVYASNPDFDEQLRGGETTFAGSGWEEALNKFLEMQSAGCFNEDPTGLSSDQAQNLLVQGEALAFIDVPQQVTTLNEKAGEERAWSLFALPGTDDPAETRLPVAPGIGYSAAADGDNVEAAKEFLDFFSQPDIQAQYAAANLTPAGDPYSPATGEPVNDVLSQIAEYQADGATSPYPDQWWPNPKVQQAHVTGVQELLVGTGSVEEILTAMDEAYNSDN